MQLQVFIGPMNFKDNLRTIEARFTKNLRTTEAHFDFSGPYKKSVAPIAQKTVMASAQTRSFDRVLGWSQIEGGPQRKQCPVKPRGRGFASPPPSPHIARSFDPVRVSGCERVRWRVRRLHTRRLVAASSVSFVFPAVVTVT